MKKLVALALIASFAASPSMAGNTILTHDNGMKLKIHCTGGGCQVTGKNPGAKWGKVERTAGGTENYNALMKKYKEKGFK